MSIALPVYAQSFVVRQEVTAVGDFFVYMGTDGKLYSRVGDSGTFTVLADLTPSGTLAVSTNDAGVKYTKLAVSNAGIILCAYSIETANYWSSEYRLVNTSGTILASGALTPVNTVLNIATYAAIPHVYYDYANSLFQIVWLDTVASMGKDLHTLNTATLTNAGVLGTVTELESVIFTDAQLSYTEGYHSENGDYCFISGVSAYRVINIATSAIAYSGTGKYAGYYYHDMVVRKFGATTARAAYSIYVLGTGCQVYATRIDPTIVYQVMIVDVINLYPDNQTFISAGCAISDDNEELYLYALTKQTDNSYLLHMHSVDITLAYNVTGRIPTLIAQEVILLPTNSWGLTPDVGMSVQVGTAIDDNGSAVDAKVNIFWAKSDYTIYYEDTWTPTIAANATELSLDLVLPSIVLATELFAYTPAKDMSLDLVLPAISLLLDINSPRLSGFSRVQLTHSLTPFLFPSEEVTYSLIINDTITIPMISFSIYRLLDNYFSPVENLQINIPSIYFDVLAGITEITVVIRKDYKLNSQVIATGILKSMQVIRGLINMQAGDINSHPLGGSYVPLNNITYIKKNAGGKLLRTKVNTNVHVGDTVLSNEFGSFTVARATTFIGANQRFTEVAE